METALEVLLEDGVIDEVLGRLKSGKEANISLVRRGDEVMAAKVYKDRATRSFKNNADYKEGRKVRNSRSQRAMESGSKFGRDAAEQEWKSAEADAMFKLVGTGVRIPTPIMFYEGVLLMDLVRDAEDRPAPRLIEVAIPKEAAVGLYADLVAQIISMLCCDLIHGDLSPYNILAAADGPTIIDFPQVISAVHSSRAEYFFLRDFDNIVAFVSGFDPSLSVHTADGRAIWRAYVSRDLTPEYVPPPPPPPRATRGPDRRSRPDDRGRSPQQRRDGRGPPPPRFEHNRPQQGRLDSRDPVQNVSAQPSRPQDDYRADPPRPPPAATKELGESRGAPNGSPPNVPQQNARWDGRGPYQGRSDSRGPQQSGGSNQGRSDSRGPQQTGGGYQGRSDSRSPQQSGGPSQGRNDSRGPQQTGGGYQGRSDSRGPQPNSGSNQGRSDSRGPQPNSGGFQGRSDSRGPQPNSGSNQGRSDSHAPQPNGGGYQGRSDSRGPQPNSGSSPPGRADSRGPQQPRTDPLGPQQTGGPQSPRHDSRAPRGYDGRGGQQQPDPRWPQPFDRQPQQPDSRGPQGASAPRPSQSFRSPPPRSEPRSYSSAPAPRADQPRPSNGPRKRRPRRRG